MSNSTTPPAPSRPQPPQSPEPNPPQQNLLRGRKYVDLGVERHGTLDNVRHGAVGLLLAEALSLCFPLFGSLKMAIERYREADDRYQQVRGKGPYRPHPGAFGLGPARGRRRRRRALQRARPRRLALQRAQRAFDHMQRAREAMEAVRTDLAYYLFKADHLTKAIAQRPDLPRAWGRDVPELLVRLQRLRGHVEGRTTPWELEFPIDEAGQRQRGEHHEAHHQDIKGLVEWRQRILAYEATRPALADDSGTAAGTELTSITTGRAAESPTDITPDPIERALALRVTDPTMSVTKIAERVGVWRQRLYDDERFSGAQKVLRAGRKKPRPSPPRGEKDAKGNLEAG